jgi:hypothetical protein
VGRCTSGIERTANVRRLDDKTHVDHWGRWGVHRLVAVGGDIRCEPTGAVDPIHDDLHPADERADDVGDKDDDVHDEHGVDDPSRVAYRADKTQVDGHGARVLGAHDARDGLKRRRVHDEAGDVGDHADGGRRAVLRLVGHPGASERNVCADESDGYDANRHDLGDAQLLGCQQRVDGHVRYAECLAARVGGQQREDIVREPRVGDPVVTAWVSSVKGVSRVR